MSTEIGFTVKEKIGVICEYPTGWRKEVNLISWNDGPFKIDIRDWSDDHEHMSRGITLHEDEAEKLYEFLAERYNGK